MKHISMVVGSNHKKSTFSILVTLFIQPHDNSKSAYLDKVIREIKSLKDEVEILYPLALKLF